MKLSKFEKVYNSSVERTSRLFNLAGVSVLLVMMLLTVLDVLLRYFFNKPILGVYELIEFFLVIIVFFAIAYTMLQSGHVSVDVWTSRISKRSQSIVASINTIISMGIAFLMTWQSLLYALSQKGRGVISPALHIPVYLVILIVSFGSALLFLALFSNLLHHLAEIRERGYLRDHLLLAIGALFAFLVLTSPIWFNWIQLKASPLTIGILGIGFMVLFLFSGLPVGFVMAIVGFMGMTYLNSLGAGISLFGRVPFTATSSHALSVLPLFLLMGALCFHSGISREIYYTVYRWLGHMPGGLAMATIGACAGFAAVSGSSVATTAAMGTVALPEMKRYKYDMSLATGCIAAGSSLGILIPPSIMLVIYGILAEQSIGQLFMAGFIPGILEALFYLVTIYIMCKFKPSLGPAGPRADFKDRFFSLKNTWGVLALFLLVIGGIYAGVFTPTEAAGIGAFGALILALIRRKLTWNSFTASLNEAGKTSSMAFVLLIGSIILGYFLTITRLPFELADFASGLEVNRYLVLGVIILIYLFLGAIMTSIAMVMLTVPIFVPVILSLGFDPIWFGIILVRVSEMGQITPPIGINVYVMKGIAEEVSLYTIFKGTIPFLIADVLHIALLISIPQISLFLPNLMSKL